MTVGDRSPDPARQLDISSALLALAVLCDSAIEHYRGSFQNRAMYAPLVTSAAALCAGLGVPRQSRAFSASSSPAAPDKTRTAIQLLSAGVGCAGLAFHAYNILKRPGGLSWLNLFYAAPVGAPAALVLSGMLGRSAHHARACTHTAVPPATTRTLGRQLAGITAVGLLGTAGEAALLHFRGAFQNPAMVLPVTLPPIGGILLGSAALTPGRPRCHRLTRWWLKLTAVLGIAGVGFHSYGIARSMGGWRNWSQNLLNGPPLPAPPSFTALAIAGLAALTLIEASDHE